MLPSGSACVQKQGGALRAAHRHSPASMPIREEGTVSVVVPAEMPRAQIGTGPYKFVECKPHQSIKAVRNPNCWKPGRPCLDGIEHTIVARRSTAICPPSRARST